MSQKETTPLISPLEVSDSPNGKASKLTELSALARQAYEQKRPKECLDLTRAILLIEPDNADAQLIRSSIEADMKRDLENTRAFLRQAHSDATTETDAVPIYPDRSGVLLSTRWISLALWLLGALVLGGLFAILPIPETRFNPAEVYTPASDVPDVSKPVANENQLPELSHTVEVVEPVSISKPARPALAPVAASPDAAVVPAGIGTLAISSPTSVDIYEHDEYVGSVPVSLELPAGAHTFEYRHGDLRRVLTHIINSDETTKAMITFDVSVQINSRPWAEVFLDGVERKPLGQTPLSGVRVPIGGVLLFENPQFETKRYRVTGNETGIRNLFP
jgi:hypothetical protein